ncbi:polyketide cyclase/dehydrase/lipid transport protein [Sinobacterium caligoides]|uniref:Polyketide cyclase/dehydrase/lipid transport protein n=1 Tax=Sinobacterium caligoides TaxID=933926 RepID=A0A3N2E0V6_9GAMM|nr:SRPBCC family protein [Sinobacterium caligoides]ROS05205.1 polyketide cyclase/dehydrase/lipid transport protein [Sinobacterium caligoides]
MKKLLFIILFIVLGLVGMSLLTTDSSRRHLVSTTVLVDKPLSVVWAQLQDFTLAHNYVPNIVSTTVVSNIASGVGAERHVYNSDGGYIVERIVESTPEQGFLLDLSQRGQPLKPFVYSAYRYAIEAADEGATRVTLTLYYQLPWGLLGEWLNSSMLQRYLVATQPDIAAGFKWFYEQGTPAGDQQREEYRSFVVISALE